MWASNRDLKFMPSESQERRRHGTKNIWRNNGWKILKFGQKKKNPNKQKQNTWMYNKKMSELKGKPEEIHVNTHPSNIYKLKTN